MTIITISRGSYSRGKEIAEKVAEKLGYECLARDVLLKTSEHYHVPEIKLVRAIHDAPSILDRLGQTKEQYVAFIEAALLRSVKNGNVVYHGLAGHFFLKGVSHVLKVRIIADIEERVRLEMERENISREKALQILQRDDGERRRWSLTLYGIDTWDPQLYDLVLHIRRISPDLAAEIICDTARSDLFQPTPESDAALDDLLIAAEVKAALVGSIPEIEVTAKGGAVEVTIGGSRYKESRMAGEIETVAKKIPGVNEIRVKISGPAQYI